MKVPCTKQQIAFALTQAASGTPVVKIKWKIGISELTFYRFEKQFTGWEGSELHRLKELAGVRVGCGYRGLHVLLKREGWEVNHY